MSNKKTYPRRYKFKKIEKKWTQFWEDEDIYQFDIKDDGQIFSIDTPPPFVSGTLHLGHILNHAWIDFVGRYHRLKGDNVYFPQGFDCHGLPVELAVTKNYGISKDNREKFLEKCIEWVDDNIESMTKQFNDLGYSTDWDYTYRTMNDDYKYKVQYSLLDFYEKGWLYREKFPTHFCVNCETSVAKAEVGYQEEEGKLWYIKLPLVGREGEYVEIATTRPEYMEACVGVFINPRDDRYYDLSAAEVKLPIADRKVRIHMEKDVDMHFGTGVVYCCTYGDEMDIKWKLKHDLDEIQIFTKDGHMNENSKYEGMTIEEAREQIVEDLDEMGLLTKIEDYEHSTIIHSERSSCRQPIEYLPVDQWFVNVKDFTDEIIESAEQMEWYPEKHKQRLIDWAEGLDWNWVISRQRVFGTPIPFWSCQKCGEIIPARKEDLPLDPVQAESPVGKCPECGSTKIEPEKDVCDCWIDSSITPLAISKWLEDNEFFQKTYMDATVHRPQGYEIIRTWLFYTLFRCKKLTGKAPFDETMINGMVAGPSGAKMSKSTGNYISPDEVMPRFGADAIRQWAAMGSLGDDYPFEYSWYHLQTKQPVSDEKIKKEMEEMPEDKFFKRYRRKFEQLTGASRFLTKIWNAYRFLYLNIEKIDLDNLELDLGDLSPIDCYFYSEFNTKLQNITENFDGYNWHEGFAILRPFFWYELCDNYIEAIKYKFYSEKPKTQHTAVKNALILFYKMLKMVSFIMPFISEEIYSIIYKKYKDKKSIHLENWPTKIEGIPEVLAKRGKMAIQIIKKLRTMKSNLQIALNQEVSRVIIKTDQKYKKELELVKQDISNTIRIENLEIKSGPEELEIEDKADSEEKIKEPSATILFFK
ncbi:MAG: valine--tRNA ligase [Promethearchaeia archaeon]